MSDSSEKKMKNKTRKRASVPSFDDANSNAESPSSKRGKRTKGKRDETKENLLEFDTNEKDNDNVSTCTRTPTESTYPPNLKDYQRMVEHGDEEADAVYGVKSNNEGKFTLGSAPFAFEVDGKIKIGDKVFNSTPGLMELIVKKYPNEEAITEADTEAYGTILEMTKAHLKKDGSKNGAPTHKYVNFIKPLTQNPTHDKGITSHIVGHADFEDPIDVVNILNVLISCVEGANAISVGKVLELIKEVKELVERIIRRKKEGDMFVKYWSSMKNRERRADAK